MKVRQLYWIGEVYNEFKANVPARTAGWMETRIPEAFSAQMLAQARALHLAGNLFPNGRLEVVPRATSAEAAPGADTDDIELLIEQYEDPAAAEGVATCTGQFTELGAGEIVARRAEKRGEKRKAAQVEEDTDVIGIEKMTAGTYLVNLAPSKDDCAFNVKVGRRNSPWLHLVRCVSDPDV